MWSARSIGIGSRKLCSRELDWKLAGSSTSTASNSVDTSSSRSTRYSGNGRPNLLRQQQQQEEVLLVASSDSPSEREEEVIEESTDEEEAERKKPPPSNVILEVDALTETLQKNCRCLNKV
jgi:hypothetical protein